MGVHEVQRELELSSPSVAHYHIKKLVEQGLAREEAGGYVVDKLFFENMIRIRRSVIPLQTTYLVLFASTFFILLTVFRSQSLTPVYFFALFVNAAAICVFAYETVKSFRKG